LRIAIIVLVAVIGAILAATVYFGRRTVAEITPGLERVESTNEQYDLVYKLPGSPQGIATNGTELMIANRRDPWGAIRLRHSGRELQSEPIPIIEPVYNQKMNLDTLTWNGTNYIGHTSAAWFEQKKEGYVFTVHDPQTMRIVNRYAAPDNIGCLAWDGTGYWASSRKNTRDADEPAFLYRLDANFKVVRRSAPPAVGCQGLAWDGEYLWFVDVFDDGIFILDVSEPTPAVVKRAYSGLEYLSGIVFFEKQIWITEYGNDRLHRIKPAMRMAWIGGEPEPEETLASVIATREASKRSDRYENTFLRRATDDSEIVAWSIELRDDGLYATWNFWFGDDLFVKREQSSSVITIPQFAKYTVTIRRPDGTEVEKEFEATPGENTMRDVKLDDANAPGEYRVSIFMHVQYVNAEGTARILNNSGTSLEVQR